MKEDGKWKLPNAYLRSEYDIEAEIRRLVQQLPIQITWIKVKKHQDGSNKKLTPEKKN